MKNLLIKLLFLVLLNQVAFSDTTLSSGNAVSGSVSEGSWKYYKISASSGTVNSIIDNLSADLDLYVKVGSRPTGDSYSCKSTHGGTNSDSCSVTVSSNSNVYIGVYGYKSGSYHVKATTSGSSSGGSSSSDVRINNVPFISQRDASGCASNYLCGFVATAMVSSFINNDIEASIRTAQDMSESTVGTRCPTASTPNRNADSFARGARELGLNAKYEFLTFEQIKALVRDGTPAIVSITYSEFGSYKLASYNLGHSVVIVGYSASRGVWFIHDSLGVNANQGAYREIPSNILRSAMQKAQRNAGLDETTFDTVIISE